jgi:hypothetical protein
MSSPATPEQAEQLARSALAQYLTACSMTGYQPVAVSNYLEMLTTVAGLLMAKAEGSRSAIRRMQKAAETVGQMMPAVPDGPTAWPSYDSNAPTRFELQAEPARQGSAPSVTSSTMGANTIEMPEADRPGSRSGSGSVTQLPPAPRDLSAMSDLFARVARQTPR